MARNKLNKSKKIEERANAPRTKKVGKLFLQDYRVHVISEKEGVCSYCRKSKSPRMHFLKTNWNRDVWLCEACANEIGWTKEKSELTKKVRKQPSQPKLVIYSKRATSVTDEKGICGYCNQRSSPLYHYAKTSIGPVDLCLKCKGKCKRDTWYTFVSGGRVNGK